MAVRPRHSAAGRSDFLQLVLAESATLTLDRRRGAFLI